MIKANRELAVEKARKQVFPLAARFEEQYTKNITFFYVFDEDDQLIGYTFVATGMGYADVIRTMVGLNLDMSINRIAVIHQRETPGLGDKVQTEGFYSRFFGLRREHLRVDKDGGNIVSLTGATITTRTVANSIREYIELLEKALLEIESLDDLDGDVYEMAD